MLAGVGILTVCGVIDPTRTAKTERLQFVFEYANACGAYFAAMALLICCDSSHNNRWCQAPVLTALMLTRSVGAIGLYAVFAVLYILKKGDSGCRRYEIIVHTAAVCAAIGIWLFPGIIAVLTVAAAYLLGWKNGVFLEKAQKLKLHWLGIAAAAAGIVVLGGRINAATHTFAERLLQICDGATVIASHPFGIGAGNWDPIYRFYQSAQYSSSVVHSGIIQFGVDAGIPAAATFIVFYVLTFRQKRTGSGPVFAGAYLLVHSLVDFDLQFFSLFALMLCLLFCETDTEKTLKVSMPRITSGLFAIPVICFLLFYATDQMSEELQREANAGNWDTVIIHYSKEKTLLGSAKDAKTAYLNSLFCTGRFAEAAKAVDWAGEMDEQGLILTAHAVREELSKDKACDFLLDELDRRMYDVYLFEKTSEMFEEWNVDTEHIARYNDIAEKSNSSYNVLGDWKGDRVVIDKIK